MTARHKPSSTGFQAPSLARFAASAGLVLAMLAYGCAAPPTTPTAPATPKPAPPVSEARALIAQGQYRAAARLLIERAEASPRPAADEYRLEAAQALLTGDLANRALALVRTMDPQDMTSGLRRRHGLLLAESLLATGQPEQALAAAPAPNAQWEPALARRSRELRARAYAADGNRLEAVRERIALAALLDQASAVRTNRQAIWELIDQIPEAGLRTLTQVQRPDILGGWLELGYRIKQARRRPELLNESLAAWQRRFPEHPAGDEFLKHLTLDLRRKFQRPKVIAVLLPLSGSLADPARAVRDGILSAHYSSPAQADSAAPRVDIYDSAGKQPIVDLYRKAIEDGAEAVIGPLSKQRVSELARSEQLEIPVLALNSTDPPQLETPDRLFQFGLLPEDEARQVAERATLDGMESALMLVPEGEWGRRVASAFSGRFQRLGGQVLERGQFSPERTDFSDPIRNLLNLDESERRYRSLRRIIGRDVEFEPRRREDVDFVFFAAFPRQARLIAPQFRFHHAADLPLFSTSHAYTGSPKPGEDRDMDGVVICDIPWVLPGHRPRPQLYRRMQEHWPQTMERYARLSGLGIDAYTLLSRLSWWPEDPRATLRGATGRLSLDARNRIHRTLQWARFDDGRLHPLTRPVVPATRKDWSPPAQ